MSPALILVRTQCCILKTEHFQVTELLFATTIAKAMLANALRYYIKNAKEREDRHFVLFGCLGVWSALRWSGDEEYRHFY